MSFIEAFIFGLLQGLTEFLPVSSSAHVKLAKLFFGVESSEAQVIFDLVCHLGTLLALLLFLREEISSLFFNNRKKLLHLFLATLPLIPCYFLLKPLREFASQPHFLGFCLIITALILFSGQKWKLKRSEGNSSQLRDIFWIGAMQSAALIPGISRSASTISCATFLGWEAREAVRFSFLLSIPTIIGGNCLELLKVALAHEMPPVPVSACVVGGITAFAVGFLVVRFALSYLEKGNLRPFAWYCLSFGALVAIYLNVRDF
ncbi:MAG: undecaprenyl-diphosphate phosphatase [Candidatus Melainabacteria bacterium]|nr:undecaprenyl-diphosphate phosphatase [Candidatus Melainabacteria bacterium]